MKRMDREDGMIERNSDLASGLAAAETMRSAAESAHVKEEANKKEDEKLSIFWRVFGGTIFSIVALVAINLFNNLYGSISELRAELNKEREARSELVKKDEFNSRSTSVYERIRAAEGMQNTLAGLKSEHEGIKERVNANALTVEAVKKDVAVIDSLRERMAAMEAVKKDLVGLDVLKEKLAAIAVDMKTTRDEFAKMNQEVSQNRAFDLERKAFRDNQAKQYDDVLKDLSKGLQECREKIARLEVQQSPMPMGTNRSVPKTANRPAPVEEEDLEPAPAPSKVKPASFEKK